MKIKIKYYASLREQAGKSQEIIESSHTNPRGIYEELKMKYNFSLSVDELQVAVNDNYEDFDHELSDSDSLVFIPPVAGG